MPHNTTIDLFNLGVTQADHGARLEAVEEKAKAIDEKLDSILRWLLGVFASTIISLLLFVFTLLRSAKP